MVGSADIVFSYKLEATCFVITMLVAELDVVISKSSSTHVKTFSVNIKTPFLMEVSYLSKTGRFEISILYSISESATSSFDDESVKVITEVVLESCIVIVSPALAVTTSITYVCFLGSAAT